MPDRSAPTTVAVVVPHYDQLPALEACMRALAVQSRPADQVVVVDNGSPCGLAEVARRVGAILPTARTRAAAPRGAAHARNLGVAETTGEAIAFLDADVVADSGWLARGLIALADRPIVGGRIDVRPTLDRPVSAVEAWDMLFGHDVGKVFARTGRLLSGNLFVRREVFRAVGDFRHGVPEDSEWCQRAMERGFATGYDPGLAAIHEPLPTLEALLARQARFAREAYAWRGERRLGRLGYAVHALMTVASIAPHGVRVVMRPEAAGQHLAVLRVLIAIRLFRFGEAVDLLRGR